MPYNQSPTGPTNGGSPCVKVCRLDSLQVCVGCGRTIHEIAGWSSLSPQQKEITNQIARERLASRQASAFQDVPLTDRRGL